MSEVLETLLVLLKGDPAQLEATLRRIERETADTKQKVSRNLDFGSIGANLGGLTGGGGILYALRELAGESQRTESAIRSFENTVNRVGGSQEAAAQMVSRVASTYGLLDSQAQAAATTLLKAGLDFQTSEETLNSLGASAGLAGADIAAAMESGARGIAYTRSELLDAAGIATNASDGFKVYAAAVGKSTEEMTSQEKAVAYARAVIREATPDVEDFADAFGEFARSQADARAESAEFRNTVGAIAQQGLIPLNQAMTSTLGYFNDLPDGTQRTATAFVAAGAGATALAAGVGTLALVLGPLVGPAGLFILAAAGIAAVITAANQAPEPIRQARDAVNELADANERLATAANTAAGAQRKNAQDEALVAVDNASAQLEAAEARLAESRDRYGYNDPGANRRLIDQIGDVPQLRRR